MITSIFNKSRPINYIIVFTILVFAFFIGVFKYYKESLNLYNSCHLLFNFLLILTTVFTLNFIVTKNDLTKDNTWSLFIIAITILIVPQVFFSTKLLLANLFVLLSVRRLVSLHTQKNTIKKLLDSGTLIALASICYVWSIWFLCLPLLAVFLHSEYKLSNWFVPILGFLAITIITFAIFLLYPTWFNLNVDLEGLNFIFTSYNTPQIIAALTLIMGLGFWFSFYYIPAIKKRKRIKWPAYKLIFLYFCVSIIVFLFKANKVVSEFILLLAPFAILAANYFQKNNEIWFKNIIVTLWMALVVYLVLV